MLPGVDELRYGNDHPFDFIARAQISEASKPHTDTAIGSGTEGHLENCFISRLQLYLLGTPQQNSWY